MKKLLALLLALTMLFALAACGTPAAPATTAPDAGATTAPVAEDVTLNIIISQYSTNTQAWWAADGDYIKNFEAANPGIKLNVEVVSWNDLYTVVNTRISTNQAPDILNIDTFADYVADDLLMPATDYASSELQAKIFPGFWSANEMDGTTWALPILASCRALYYNKDILAQAGVEVPTNWDELTAACAAIKEKCPGIVPWGLDISTDEGQAAFVYYTWNNGGGFVDADNNWALNSAANVEALQYIKSLVDAGYCNADPYTDTRYPLEDAFIAGSQAFMIGPNGIAPRCTNVNYGVASIPTQTGEAVNMGVCDRLMVFKNDKEGDAARTAAISKFFDYFYDTNNYSQYMVYEGFLPVTSDSADLLASNAEQFTAGDGTTKGDSGYFANFNAILAACNFYPTAKTEWIDVKQGVIDAEQRVCQGEDAQTVLDELQAKIAG